MPEDKNRLETDIPKIDLILQSPKHNKQSIVYSAILIVLVALGVATWMIVQNNKSSTSILANNKSAKTVSSSTTSSKNYANIPNAINPINPAAIPLGTGKVSTTPQVGYVDFCRYTAGSVGAEPTNLPWIDNANNTWNPETKPSVAGSVSWASLASYTNTISGNYRIITTNDLPIDHNTGVYPISLNDPVYQWDHNPNHITSQPTTWQLAANPTPASSPSCTNAGPIGVLNDGVFLFNALDAQSRDAGATEVVDQWQGHPQAQGVYHHHVIPNYMLASASAKSSSTLIGYALDGYGIYIERDANGNLLTNANLDVCHGRISWVMWNGKMTYMYHYDVTLEYPYTVGCFHGTPISITPLRSAFTSATSRPNQPKRF